MKRIVLLAIVALFACTTQLSARTYSHFYGGYDMMKIGDSNINGLSLGWVMGIPLMKNQPLNLELGANAQYGFGEDDGVDYSLFSVNVPANVVYRWSPVNGFAIAPYVGLNFRGNITGTQEYAGTKYDIFEDLDGKRFQVGGNVGVSMTLWVINVGVGYTVDFMNFAESRKMKNLSISFGFRF